MKEVKEKLYAYCKQWVEEKVKLAEQAIKSAQASANEETKSSAGDKYETSRAMAQLEIEKNSYQLAETNKMKRLLGEFSPTSQNPIVGLGSLIETNSGWFYLSISAGEASIDGKSYICLSAVSPLGAQMVKKQVGDSFGFNGKDYLILKIY